MLLSPFPFLTPSKYQQTQSLSSKTIINNIISKYHCSNLINLQDQITFHQQQQNLKRTYSLDQYDKKIIALSQYYRFHFEAPRLFMKNICDTVDHYISDKRDLEFKKVTKMMESKSKREDNKVGGVKKNHKRLLGDIEVSYVDFENKNNNDQRVKQEKKKATFRHLKSPSLATYQGNTGGLANGINQGLTRQKSNLGMGLQNKRLIKQPSLNTLIRAKSKRDIRSDLLCPIKPNTHHQRNLIPLSQVQNQINKPNEVNKIPQMKRQKSKITLTKTKSSMNLKNFSLKNIQSQKSSLRPSKNQSNATDTKQKQEVIKPLTSRKVSIQDTISRHQKQNYQFSNKYRSSIENILFKTKKLK